MLVTLKVNRQFYPKFCNFSQTTWRYVPPGSDLFFMLPLSEQLISHYNIDLFCGIAVLPLLYLARLIQRVFFVVLGLQIGQHCPSLYVNSVSDNETSNPVTVLTVLGCLHI